MDSEHNGVALCADDITSVFKLQDMPSCPTLGVKMNFIYCNSEAFDFLGIIF
jgi:hypothetical protein